MRRFLIIGMGAAGLGAAEAIRSQDPSGEILLISEEAEGYYSRPGLAYLLSGEIPERQLYPLAEADCRRLAINKQQGRVQRIDLQEHRILFENGKKLAYDRLLVATGSTAVKTNVPGADLKGVVKLDNLQDVRQIMSLGRKRGRAVVVGGGITALEIVEGLGCRGVNTTYFLRGDRYWSNVLDETESRIVEHRLREDGVKINYNTELAEILGQRGAVIGVRTKDGRQYPCNLVAVAIGVRPRKELGEVSGLRTERSIVVDEFLRTSDPDVFAAGDVAQLIDPLTGQSIMDTLWGPAREQGYYAGLNMAGAPAPYRKGVPFNVTRLAGLTTTIIGQVGGGRDEDLVGIARGDSEGWRQLPDATTAQSDFEVNRLRLLVGKEFLVGAILLGDQTLSIQLQHLISKRVPIAPIREQLLQPGAPLGELLIDFWQNWKNTHANHRSRTAQ